MATSERVLTTITSAPSERHAASRVGWNSARSSIWRLFLLDVATIALALSSMAFLSARGVWLVQSHYGSVTLVTWALGAIAVLAFTGAYPQRRTPLNIAATEGLVKGASCLLFLLAIAVMGFRTTPGLQPLLIAGGVGLSVLAQREMVSPWATKSAPQSWQLHRATAVFRSAASASFDDFDEPLSGAQPHWVESPSGFRLKRALDLVVASLVGLAASPLLLLVAGLIKLDSLGPVFVRQRRIGRDGLPFYMWKFRSMHQGVARYERSPVSTSDIRLTRVGRILRRLSIDEIPQLLNVIQGDMSLVGPRPEMPFIVEQYRNYERLRLNAIPGITGLWQISPARAIPIHHNVELDLYYIQHRNLFLDVAILLRTVSAVIRGIGAA